MCNKVGSFSTRLVCIIMDPQALWKVSAHAFTNDSYCFSWVVLVMLALMSPVFAQRCRLCGHIWLLFKAKWTSFFFKEVLFSYCFLCVHIHTAIIENQEALWSVILSCFDPVLMRSNNSGRRIWRKQRVKKSICSQQTEQRDINMRPAERSVHRRNGWDARWTRKWVRRYQEREARSKWSQNMRLKRN